MNNYDIGDEIFVNATFRDSTPELADPTTVRLKIRTGRGASSTYTYGSSDIERVSEGVYRFPLTLDVPGRWTYRWEGSESPKTASETELYVRPSVFA